MVVEARDNGLRAVFALRQDSADGMGEWGVVGGAEVVQQHVAQVGEIGPQIDGGFFHHLDNTVRIPFATPCDRQTIALPGKGIGSVSAGPEWPPAQ